MKVTFQIEGAAPVTIECNAGDNLLELARRANVAIDAPCSGNGSCGKCRVKLVEGQLESLKSRHITDEEYEAGWRLSCNSKVLSDCTVFVPDIASAYQSRMKTADLSSPKEIAIFEDCQNNLKESGIHFVNNFRSVVVTMAEPTLDDTMPDNERFTWAVQEALGVEKVHIPFCVMVKLAHTLREYNWSVCVKGEVRGDTFCCMEVCDPADTAIVGCAIDIGTTTVTMVFADLTSGKLLAKGSSGNGQIRYGADVINRIIESGRSGGKAKLQNAIIKETLTPIMANLCRTAGVNARSILRLSVGSNTTMNHLLLGVDAQSVRMEPYIPSFFSWEGLLAGDLHLPAHPLAPVRIAPNIGSYVGGDITAGTLASGIWDKDEAAREAAARKFAVESKAAAQTIAKAGKLFMYHNHHYEYMTSVDGKNVMKYLADEFAPNELGFTLDTYWVQAAGADLLQHGLGHHSGACRKVKRTIVLHKSFPPDSYVVVFFVPFA